MSAYTPAPDPSLDLVIPRLLPVRSSSSQQALTSLPGREREVAAQVYQGRETAEDVRRSLRDPLSNSAVRSMLRRLEKKGVIAKRKEGKKFIYLPTVTDHLVGRAALRRLVHDFFQGSFAGAAAMLEELRRDSPPAPGEAGIVMMRG